MNEIRRENPDARLVRDVGAIVEQQGWPDFIEGFSIHLGWFDGDPAGWVTYRIKREEAEPREGWEQRGDTLSALAQRVSLAIANSEFSHQFYFRFDDGIDLLQR